MKFSITDLFSKCDQIRRKLRIWSHLLKKFVMEIFFFFCSGLRQMDEWALEVGIMSGDFKLRISLSDSFVFVCCVVLNKRMLCFYSMQSAWELLGMVVLIQSWTQVIDYLLPGVTWLTRLRISMSHLSISGMIVRGRYYNSHCFFFCYFLWLLVGWSLFFVFVFMSLDSGLRNQEPILICLLLVWLIIKRYQICYGFITLYYSIYSILYY